MSEKEYIFVGNAQLKTRDYIKQIERDNRDKDKKIERLTKRLEEAQLGYLAVEEKNKRLNNIINELEKSLKWQRKVSLSLNEAFAVSRIDTLINKLQKLKGSNK